MKIRNILLKSLLVCLCVSLLLVGFSACGNKSSSGDNRTFTVVIDGQEQIVKYGTVLKRPADPVKPENEGYIYTFDNWYYGDKVYDWSKPVKRNMEIEARYSRTTKSYEVTYTINGETNTKTLKYKTNLSSYDGLGIPKKPASSPVKLNKFVGWLKKGESKPEKDLLVSGNMEVEAIFEEVDNYGELIIEDMTVYTNSPKYFVPKFPVEGYEEELTYTFDNDKNIKIENGTIRAVRVDTETMVTAKSEHYETTFKVTIPGTKKELGSWQQGYGTTPVVKYGHYYYTNPYKDLDSNDTFDYWVEQRDQQAGEFHRLNGGIDLMFVGDSFFCPDHFWTNFYTKFKGKNIMTVGIGSSTTYEWDVWADQLIFPYAPKNIALHLGTNDLWNCVNSGNETGKNVIDFIEHLREIMPDVNIYWYTIEYREYSSFNQSMEVTNKKVRDANKVVKAYCDKTERVTFLDSFTFSSTDDGMYIKPGFLRDGTHPTLENYDKYIDLLGNYIDYNQFIIEQKTPLYGVGPCLGGGDFVYNKELKTLDFTGGQGRTRSYIYDQANGTYPEVYDFKISGNLKMKNYTNNSFVEILLMKNPDSSWVETGRKDKIDFIYQKKENHFDLNIWGYGAVASNSEYTWDTTDKESFDFEIVKQGKNVTYTINGVAKTLVTDANSLGFGKENCDFIITDFNMELMVTKA